MSDKQSKMPFYLVGPASFLPDPTVSKDVVPLELERVFDEVGVRWQQKSAPLVTIDHQRQLQENPDWIFVLLWQTVKHYESPEDQSAYYMRLYLFGEMLFCLRVELESGRPWASEVVTRIQQEIARYVFVPEYNRAMQTDFIEIMQRSRLPLHSELEEANLKVSAYDNRFSGKEKPYKLVDLLKGLRVADKDDVFQIGHFLAKQMARHPIESQIDFLSFLAADEHPQVIEILALMLLHGEARIRRLTVELLRDLVVLKRMSPQMLRRLIVIRNWLPEVEQVVLDRLIRQAQLARVTCASAEPGELVSCCASGLDGSGEQVFWLAFESDNQWHGCRLIFSQAKGLTEVKNQAFASKEAYQRALRRSAEDVKVLPIDSDFLETAIAHYLAIGLNQGVVPPMELLQLAEWFGNLGWAPHRVAVDLALKALLLEAEHRYSMPRNQERIINLSANKNLRKHTQGWLLQGEDVEICLLRHLGGPGRWAANQSQAKHLICSELLEQDRESWMMKMIWTALWLRATNSRTTAVWKYFAVIAARLSKGKSISEIPLLYCVAERTLQTVQTQVRQYAAMGKA